MAETPATRLLGQPAYHALTYGWLISGLARAVTGIGMGELIRTEVAQVLNTDGLHLGRPPADAPTKVAEILMPQSARANTVFNLLAPKYAALWFSGGLGAMYFPGVKAFVQGDIPFLDSEIPSVNGVVTARGLAKMYGAIANGGCIDGIRYLSADLVRGLAGRPSLRPDLNIFVPLSWHLGYHSVPVPGVMPGFGHAGLGGSIGWADPSSGMSFAFVHNRLLTPMMFDQAAFVGLVGLLRRGAAAARRNGSHVVPRFGSPYPQPPGVVAG